MGFIYPYRLTLKRPARVTAVGALPYGGLTIASETVIASSLKASIQYSRGEKHYVGLPGDTVKQTVVYIYIRTKVRDLILDGDVLVNEGSPFQRFQAASALWDSLGYKLTALQLET